MKDYEVVQFQTKEEMENYLAERETDIWATPRISRCSVLAGTESEEKIAEILKQSNIEISEETLAGCSPEDTFFLKFPYKKNCAVVPLRYTAINSVLKRAGIGGKTITNTDENAQQRILTMKEKASILTKFLHLYDSKCKILVREEKVSAMLSEQYAILSMSDLVKAINEQLQKEYPMAEYARSCASHEFFSINWKLNDDDTEESLRDILQSNEEVASGLRFLTSDIGCANASVYPYFYIGNRMLRFGKPMEIKHMGRKTVEDFAKLLPGINASFKSNLKYIENLEGLRITHPADCFRAIACKIGLPKKVCMKLAEELEQKPFCSAFEIYYHLNLVLENVENKGVTYLLELQEAVASTLYMDYAQFDYPFAWVKGE